VPGLCGRFKPHQPRQKPQWTPSVYLCSIDLWYKLPCRFPLLDFIFFWYNHIHHINQDGVWYQNSYAINTLSNCNADWFLAALSSTSDKSSFAYISARDRWPVILVCLCAKLIWCNWPGRLERLTMSIEQCQTQRTRSIRKGNESLRSLQDSSTNYNMTEN